MCSCNGHRTDYPPWRGPLPGAGRRDRRRLRTAPVAAAGVLAALAGLAVYLFTPTDIERAEADLHKAWAVVNDLQEEGIRAGRDARDHSRRGAEGREAAGAEKDSADAGYREYCQSVADANRRLGAAKWARRDALIHLTAEYLRLLAEAECEILRAKDARDRGTPYKVAPRVRDLLAPILAIR